MTISVTTLSVALWWQPASAQQSYAPWGQNNAPANGAPPNYYARPGGYAPPAGQGYAPANGGQPYAPGNGGYAQSLPAYGNSAAAPYPPGVTPPPSGNYQPTWQPIPGTPLPRYGAPPGRPPMQQMPANSQLEQLIPNWNGPLPQVPASMSRPLPQGPGFASGWAPGPPQIQASPQEQRVARLEQAAFGATYPEHEVDDRVEHLEREEFGKSTEGDLDSRLSRLEAKLGGGNAFGKTSSAQMPPNTPPSPPAMMATSQLPTMTAPSQAAPPDVKPLTAYQPPAGYRAPGSVAAAPNAAAHQPATAGAAPNRQNDDLMHSQFDTAVQSIPIDQKAGDYFAAMQVFTAGSYARWTHFPVRMHLPMNTPPNWQAGLDSAIQQWSKAVPIMVTSPQEPADIEVAWINHLQPHQLGITNLEVFNGRMRVTVYLLRPSSYPAGTAEQKLPVVAAHQMGHALGLWGHSQAAGDVMHPLDSAKGKATIVSARDINTLRRIYQAPGLPAGYESPQPVGWP